MEKGITFCWLGWFLFTNKKIEKWEYTWKEEYDEETGERHFNQSRERFTELKTVLDCVVGKIKNS